MPKWTEGIMVTVTVPRAMLELCVDALKNLTIASHFAAGKDRKLASYYRELADRADTYAEHLRRLISDR